LVHERGVAPFARLFDPAPWAHEHITVTVAALGPLKPPAPYYGGKTRLAPWIVSMMGPHRSYLEPFAGTASVLLAKPPARLEVINDVDGEVVTFFRVLRDRPGELERACRLTPYARDEFMACRAPAEDLDELERARRWWTRIVQGFNNAPGTWSTGWSLSVRRGTSEPNTAANLVERFEAVAERLRTVAIENTTAANLIDRFDGEDAVIYCDPPYLAETRRGRERRAAVHDYAHDMLTPAEHRDLAQILTKARGHVLLSGYPSDLYDELYEGWWRAESRVVRNAASRRGGPTVSHATEVIWSNRPLDGDHLFSAERP
jgi:DNA adenine methylase